MYNYYMNNSSHTHTAAQPKVEGVDLVSLMFGTVCQEITKSLQELRENNSDLLRKMFQLVCTAHASLIQVYLILLNSLVSVCYVKISLVTRSWIHFL